MLYNYNDANGEYMSKDDVKYMTVALDMATTSVDERTKVGACLVGDGEILDRTVNEPVISNFTKEEKNMVFEHAERIAMLRNKNVSESTTLYVTLFPCPDCARAIVLSGVNRVVFHAMPHEVNSRISTSYVTKSNLSLRILSDNGVVVDSVAFKSDHKLPVDDVVLDFNL